MQLLVPRERAPGERRVAVSAETVGKLTASGATVLVEAGAGRQAGLDDDAVRAAGATVVDGDELERAWSSADAVALVQPPGATDEQAAERLASLADGALVVGLLAPHRHPRTVEALARAGATALAFELVPRVTRAQPMDALSSQASLAGYRAVVRAAAEVDKQMPLFMTAAGTIRPGRVVVLGAGVAGLQAVATAKRLGAVVEVSDIRPEAKGEVESLGGRFIDVPGLEVESEGGYAPQVTDEVLANQRELLTERMADADVVICTAQVPARPAPRLVSREMVEAMPDGAVIIDLPAADGGNCELTRDGERVEHAGVAILGEGNLAASMPGESSGLYARNVAALLGLCVDDDGALAIDRDDEILAAARLTDRGEVVDARFAGDDGPSGPGAGEPGPGGAAGGDDADADGADDGGPGDQPGAGDGGEAR